MKAAGTGVAFVTGATGFVGRHLVRRLIADGWSVHALVRDESRLAPLEGLQGLEFHAYDGTLESVSTPLANARPQVIFHLATHFVGEHKPEELGAMLDANITLGIQVLEAMNLAGVHNLVNAGTAWQTTRGADYSPANLYAAMKQAFEDLMAYYVKASALHAVTLRLFDTYGPDDPRGKLFGALAAAGRDGASLNMSPGEQIIDLLYIDDAVEGFLRAALHVCDMTGPAHQVFALSSGDRHTLKEVVEIFSRISGSSLDVIWGGRPYRANEVMVPWTRGIPLPEWSPSVKLEEGIRRMIRADV